jgi:GWxTD domain-containing protein
MRIARWGMVFVLSAAAAGCGVSVLPSHDEWYASHYFVMQKFETDAYKALTPNGRLEFQKIFWAVRSPVAMAEFEVRMKYIADNFKTENRSQPWNCDRARIYLLHGSPASRDYTTNDAWSMQVTPGTGQSVGVDDRAGEDIQARTLEVWTYPFGQQIVAYGFTFQPPNKWRQAAPSATAGRYIGQFELRDRMEIWGAQDEEAYKGRLAELKAVK